MFKFSFFILFVSQFVFADERACLKNEIWKSLCAPQDQIEFFCQRLGANPMIMEQFKISYEQKKQSVGSENSAKLASGGILRGPFVCP